MIQDTEMSQQSFDTLLSRIEQWPTKKDDCDDKDNRSISKQKGTWIETKHSLLKNRYHKDTLTRFILACSTQLIIAGWLACVVIILMGKAHLSLSDSVLITLLATTTTTVIGLALIVLKGFFQHMNQDVELKD